MEAMSLVFRQRIRREKREIWKDCIATQIKQRSIFLAKKLGDRNKEKRNKRPFSERKRREEKN